MRLVFLGTGSAKPTAKRGLSGVCLEADGEVIMFDAGEGAQLAYLRSGLGWNKRMRVFITHMHGDHCTGLLGLLQTMSLQDRIRPVEVYGPPGIEEFVVENSRMLNFGPRFPVAISEVQGAGQVARGDGYAVSACEAEHSIHALSYLFVQDDRPGRFSRESARALGVPEGAMWHDLQCGRTVTVGGRDVTPSQVLGESRRGVRIGVSGDTRPTARLGEFFAGCDYLVFDSTFSSEHARQAEKTGHSTAAEAAGLAAGAGVKNLILTHISSRYKDPAVLLGEARARHGSVTLAEDMMAVPIGAGGT